MDFKIFFLELVKALAWPLAGVFIGYTLFKSANYKGPPDGHA